MVKLALVLAAIYAAVAIAAFIAQRKLMYFPDPERVPPSNFGLAGVEGVRAEEVLDPCTDLLDAAHAHRLRQPGGRGTGRA